MPPAQPHIEALLPLTPLTAAILLALAEGEQHGYAIMKEIERQGGPRRTPGAGSLYAALQRLTDQALLEECESPRPEADDARRRYYRLTAQGREVLRHEMLHIAGLLSTAVDRKILPRLNPSLGVRVKL